MTFFTFGATVSSNILSILFEIALHMNFWRFSLGLLWFDAKKWAYDDAYTTTAMGADSSYNTFGGWKGDLEKFDV